MKVSSIDVRVEEVDENLFRMVIPQPFYEPNNIYLVADDLPMIIDTGYIGSFGYLVSGLKHLGYSLNKIEYALITHNHVDHISGSLLFSVYAKKIKKLGHYGLKKQSDYLLYFHSWIQENERLIDLAFNEEETRQKYKQIIRNRWHTFLQQFDKPVPKKGDRYIDLFRGLKDLDTFSTGKYEWEILETPGHNQWHITPVENRKKWIFTGDLIIGNIPAIYSHSEGSVCDYIESIGRLRDFKEYKFFPGHGEKMENPERKIKILLKSLSIMEKNLEKRIRDRKVDALELTKEMLGSAAQNEDSLLLGIALTESVLRKLLKEKKIDSTMYYNGYEVFHA